jgi:serine/threonine protein phosphatase PrpC
MRAILETAAGETENQDRGAVIDSSVGLVLVVADGAGGLSGGKEAAAMAVDLVRKEANALRDTTSCVMLLQRMDQAIADNKIAGETTCGLAVVTESEAYGASVGDSGVWVINESGFINLTARQSRKPFIGSGVALPIPFDYTRTGKESLLLATDGLLKYASPERIMETCRENAPLAEIARRLIELVRYRSGALPDDVTVIFASPESRWTS